MLVMLCPFCESHLLEIEKEDKLYCLKCAYTFQKNESKFRNMNYSEVLEKLEYIKLKREKRLSKPTKSPSKHEGLTTSMVIYDELHLYKNRAFETELQNKDVNGREAYLEELKRLRGE